MAGLYIDTCQYLVLGLLSDDCSCWLSYQQTRLTKSSQDIHILIKDLLEQNNLLWDDIIDIFLTSGPGSYTGMRVSEGIGQILELEGHNLYSFYHFDLLELVDPPALWLSDAFKGDLYLRDVKGKSSLISVEDFRFDDYPQTTWVTLFEEKLSVKGPVFVSTATMIKEMPEKIFPKIKSLQLRKPVFYYRNETEEFVTVDRQGKQK